MHVIGTAGHVDHGKSTLVAALTGTHPDRLKEEREREMTIDLGFGWMDLPGGETIGIVDVPGHRDFINNMLSGVGGIDAVLFVVAANEGVMPQTREHLTILDILQVTNGVVAITKSDLIEEAEWFELIESDLYELFDGTVLSQAPVIHVSARTGVGLAELKIALTKCLANTPEKPDYGRPRLPIDRVFSMPGFGTVLTGTLADGKLSLGDEVVLLPSGKHGRIRGLQTHKQKVNIAIPGSRTAVNLSGINVNEVNRGDVLIYPNQYQPSKWLDVQFKLSPDVIQPLKHNDVAKLFIGTSEVIVRVRILGEEIIQPGKEGWLQLELKKSVVAARGDHYILRRPSPSQTLGGGVVLDTQSSGRHKRFTEPILEKMTALSSGTPEDLLLQAAMVLMIAPFEQVLIKTGLDKTVARQAAETLFEQNQLISLDLVKKDLTTSTLIISQPNWSKLVTRILEDVHAYHLSFPLRNGIPREQLKSRLQLEQRSFLAVINKMVAEKTLVEFASLLADPLHRVEFTPQQEKVLESIMERFKKNPFSPPGVKDCVNGLGSEVFNALLSLGRLMLVSEEICFQPATVEKMIEGVFEMVKENGSFTTAQFRDRFNTTRKYALSFLEYLDSQGITVREGDFRRLRI